MYYRIYENGSYDLICGDLSLLNAYPAVDGVPVRPLRVETGADFARYQLTGGSIELRFTEKDGLLAIDCLLESLTSVHDIEPVSSAAIKGCDRAFIQGFGIGGPSGFRKLNGEKLESHSIVAAGSQSACLAIYARDQKRLHQFSRMEGNALCTGFDTECLPLTGGALPTLYLREGTSFSDVLHRCAVEIAETMRARKVTEPAFHWCSWYYLYHTLDQPTLEEYLDGFNRYRDIAPFTHIQIDAGYFPSCGDWLDAVDRFPGGLKLAADTIRQAGYEPGIWIWPFMVGDNSRLYREHPDWMLRSADGGLVCPWIHYNEPKPWGYRDSEYYVLDTSHPEAMAYLKHVFATLREWGYTLFKTDFLLWGLQDSSKVLRHTPGKTSFEYFRDVMTMIRETIGEDARWLGCIAPFMPALGYVDMMRIGGDVGAQWEEGGFGPVNMLQELTADQYFNNVYWQNDPDAVMLRDFHIHLKPEQIEALAILEAMSGGTIYTSDPVHQMGEDRRRLLNFIRPDGLHNPEYPFWSDLWDELCLVQRLNTRTLVYFFNPTDRPVLKGCDWAALVGKQARYLRRYHGETAPIEQVPFVEIPPRSGVLYFATGEPLDADPANLWEESY